MKLAKKVLLVFALLVVIGGIQGMMAGSAASLIAAVISAALLLYSRWLWGEKNLPGLIVGLVVSIALLGRFASAAVTKGLTMWPGGVVIFFSVVTIVVLIAAFLQEKKGASGSQEAHPAGEASVDAAGQAESGKAEVEEAEEEGAATTTTTTEPEEAEEAGPSEDA